MASASHWSPDYLQGQLNYNFENFENCLSPDHSVIDNLTDDCHVAFTALNSHDEASDHDDLSSIGSNEYHNRGSTYFQRSDLPGRCCLEVLALSIFRFHTKDAHFNPALSGAEWWTQVVDSNNDIGFHWDRDYGHEQGTGENLYPHLATVTYLTDKGGPTVILNKEGCSRSEADHSGTADVVILSTPLPGKHIKFDGRLLHAAPSNLIPQHTSRGVVTGKSTRITFLVNIWLNHIPCQAISFPEDLIGRFSPMLPCSSLSHFEDSVGDLLRLGVSPSTSSHSKVHSVKQSSKLNGISNSSVCASLSSISISSEILVGTLDLHRWRFVNGGHKYSVSIPLSSSKRLASLFNKCSSISFTYSGSGVCPIIEALYDNCDTLDKSQTKQKKRRKFWRPFHHLDIFN